MGYIESNLYVPLSNKERKMNGTVTRLRARGVEATMDEPVDTIVESDRFQVYRLDSNNNEVIVGVGFPKRPRGPNMINLNPIEGTVFDEPLLGDLIRPI
jgi:hypothetical protein